MTRAAILSALAAAAALAVAHPGWTQTPPVPAAAPSPGPGRCPRRCPCRGRQPAKDSLSIFFDTGSSGLRADALPVLDQAARLYRAGQPIVMILTATTDPTGSPIANLDLSQLRADAVLRGLVARGIPAERFQLLAKGETELPVPAKPGQSEPRDRQVQIAWR